MIKENFIKKEKNLSQYATLSSEAIRLNEENSDFRPSFYRDIDRIINYSSFTRYMNKTQVFSFNQNDNVQTRLVHVLLVSKIARTISRALNLNEDLTEAIALAHDIGHSPLGHVGEHILNEISIRELNEVFMHNIESVRNYITLENNGLGSNLTIQVLDGIMCHNGEVLSNKYIPRKKTKEQFLEDYNNAYKLNKKVNLTPMTLEGCVVRISDCISYAGRDIEDAIRLNYIKRENIPENITKILGNTNKEIVNTIVMDIINNSLDKNYLLLSNDVFQALNDLIKFNYENIYNKANNNETINYYKKAFNNLYNKYKKDLEENNTNSNIYTCFINDMSDEYKKNTKKERMILDYISLMTDDYFIREAKKVIDNN